MNKVKYYANVPDLSYIPDFIVKMVMHDWFDKNDTIIGKERIDDIYVRIIGKNEEQIKARVELLKEQKSVNRGGGVRIKEVKR